MSAHILVFVLSSDMNAMRGIQTSVGRTLSFHEEFHPVSEARTDELPHNNNKYSGRILR